jgi:hypothetical protein
VVDRLSGTDRAPLELLAIAPTVARLAETHPAQPSRLSKRVQVVGDPGWTR